ncbi:MAG: hypothetical protein QOF48_3286 [Verrucomicrobiota bacterium]|jgi:hypothetical protein
MVDTAPLKANAIAWPKDTQEARNAFYGDPGRGEIPAQMVPVVPPFAMYYEGKRIANIQFHKKAAPALLAALNEIWDACGRDQKKIDAAGVSKYAGAYNHRMVRGSATKWSNHAYACAIDLNAEENGLNAGQGNMPQFVIDAFCRQGWMWGGWYSGRTDPMHFEAVDNGGRQPKNPVPVFGSTVVPVSTNHADLRSRMARVILNFEARRDGQGRLAVYKLPANDGGGTYEVAGINDKYHPDQASKLRSMIEAGKYAEAELLAVEYMAQYTDALPWFSANAGVEFYLRDCVFNRGPTGAAKILQLALGVEADGIVGQKTRAAAVKIDDGELLKKLRAARERYEDIVASGRPNLRQGLINRWNNALTEAKKFSAETRPGSEIVLPPIILPPPGVQAKTDLAPTFWGRVTDLFRPKGN